MTLEQSSKKEQQGQQQQTEKEETGGTEEHAKGTEKSTEGMLDLDTLEQQVTGIATGTTGSMEGIQTDSKRGRSSSPEDGIGSPDSKARRVLLGTDSEHTASTEHTAQEIESLKNTIAQMNTALVTCMDLLTQTNAKVKNAARHHCRTASRHDETNTATKYACIRCALTVGHTGTTH